MRFFVGLHDTHVARHFERAFISVNRLRRRRSDFPVNAWVMDSGAFTEIATHGRYRSSVAEYAADIRRWAGVGQLEAAVAQDWMCEPFILEKTGLDVAEHQRLTIDRFDELSADDCAGVPIMPVLQGWHPRDYAEHAESYGERLAADAWVGVGSVCKRNADPKAVRWVLEAILEARPSLRLHGFGVKLTALADPRIREMLYSADSMAWSFSARKQGRGGNNWQDARAFVQRVERLDAPASPGPLFETKKPGREGRAISGPS